MAKSSSTKKTIINPFNILPNIRDQTPSLTADQKADIRKGLKGQRRDYLALSGVNPNATYCEITGALTTVSTNLKSIRDRRSKLKNALTSA